MNHIFKIKQNRFGQSVVTSELAKNNGKIASVLLSALLSSGIAFAEPVSLQGSATSADAVSIGSNSYATAIDGVATGQSSVATGENFSREDFNLKVEANKAAVDAVNNKQSEINNNSNLLDATIDAIDSLTNQISDLSKQQDDIANKIAQRNNLIEQQDGARSKIEESQIAVDTAKANLDSVLNDGKNLYLNFTDVLNSLDWSVLSKSSDSNAARNVVAGELQTKIEANYNDFASKYTSQDYRDIVDGYLNRQASYQGSYEYLANATKDEARARLTDKVLFNQLYFNSSLDNADYSVTDDYKVYNFDKVYTQAVREGRYDFFGNLINDQGKSVYGSAIEYTNGYPDITAKNTYTAKLAELNNESVLNTHTLASLSKDKAESEMGYSALRDSTSFYFLIPETNLSVEGVNFKNVYSELVLQNIADASRIGFGIKTIADKDNTVKRNLKTDRNSMFAGTGGSQFNLSPHFYDKNIGVLSKIQDLTVNNENLLSTDDIAHFKNFLAELTFYRDSIDWNFDKSAINLVEYRKSLDKVITYNEKINSIVDLYQEIINERKKADADSVKIDTLTLEMMNLKSVVIDGIADKTNFGMGIELEYNKEWADYYLYYAKNEADAMISRINSELKLYNDKDELIVEATSRAKEIQDAYDNAMDKLLKDKEALDNINKQIDELELTESEKAVDDVKRNKEKELAEREADKSRLEEEINKSNEELVKLREELSKIELKDLGLRSQAQGSNAFASGNDSIAIGTNSTVTANSGIGIGQNATVTGEKSVAIGANSVVTGKTSATIGISNTISGDNSFIIGSNNSVASSNVMVLGNNISVSEGFDGSVVLGDSSSTAKSTPIQNITIQGNIYDFAGTAPTSTVSVGSQGAERQIVNVAAGRISESSTDAINGSQLYAVISAVEAIDTTPNIVAGNNINIVETPDESGKTLYNIHANQTTVTAGEGVTVTSKAIAKDGYTVTDYVVSISDTILAKLNETAPVVEAPQNVVNEYKGDNVVAGKNITVVKTPNDEGFNDAVVSLADDIDVNSVKVGDVNITVDGGINAGDKPISNVAAGTNPNDAVNVSQLNEARSDVKAGSEAMVVTQEPNNETGGQTFIVDLSDGTKAQIAKEESVSAGKNIVVNHNGTNETGGNDFVVSLSDEITVQAVNVGSASITADKGIDAGGKPISNVAAGVKPTDAVNVAQLNAISKTTVEAASEFITVDELNNSDGSKTYKVDASKETKAAVAKVNKGFNVKTQDGKSKNVQLGDTVSIVGDGKNITTLTAPNGDIQVALADDAVFNTVKTAKPAEISPTSREVVQGSQLHATNQKVQTNAQNIKRLDDKIDKNKKQARKGVASAAAMAMLPQPTISGHSIVGAATTHYRGEQALAVGYSRLSDNGRHLIKLSGASNLTGKKEAIVGAAYGFQW